VVAVGVVGADTVSGVDGDLPVDALLAATGSTVAADAATVRARVHIRVRISRNRVGPTPGLNRDGGRGAGPRGVERTVLMTCLLSVANLFLHR